MRTQKNHCPCTINLPLMASQHNKDKVSCPCAQKKTSLNVSITLIILSVIISISAILIHSSRCSTVSKLLPKVS